MAVYQVRPHRLTGSRMRTQPGLSVCDLFSVTDDTPPFHSPSPFRKIYLGRRVQSWGCHGYPKFGIY